MTKTELLLIMESLGACFGATEYVENHSSKNAAVIGGTCDRADWLMWMLHKQDRLDRFVSVAARRAQRQTNRQAHFANQDAHNYCFGGERWLNRVESVAYYARENSADAIAERAAQLKGLQRIWRDWCAGKPAEKALAL